MRRGALPGIGLVLSTLLACRARTIELGELDELNRSLGMETLVYRPTFSLYSPYEATITGRYASAIAQDLQAVSELLHVEPSPPVVAWLWPTAGLGMQVRREGDLLHFTRADVAPPTILGFAREDWAVIRVGPPQRLEGDDGTVGVTTYAPSLYRGVIRHELAHVVTRRAGLEGAPWFREGLARTIEFMEYEGDRLVLTTPPEILRDLASSPPSTRQLAALLDWPGAQHPPDPAVARWYALAHSYVLYRVGDGAPEDLGARLRELADLSREEHLAGEADWWAWLDALGEA